MNKILNLRFKI